MDIIEKAKSDEEKFLEAQIAKIQMKKWGKWVILRFLAVGIIGPFVLPLIPMRRGSSAERMGYENAVLFFVAINLIIIPIASYMYSKKVDEEVMNVKRKLLLLKLKQKESTDSKPIN